MDIVAANIPARIRPAIIEGMKPCVLSRCAIFTIMVSELESFRYGIMPFAVMPLPTMPMMTATPREITTQIVATRLERVSFSLSPIAMNLSSIWGIPK